MVHASCWSRTTVGSRRATALALQEEGYQVLEAAEGKAGLRLLAERQPDMVVLEVMLPGQDGFQVCREIRKTSDIAIIFLTAKTDTVSSSPDTRTAATSCQAKTGIAAAPPTQRQHVIEL